MTYPLHSLVVYKFGHDPPQVDWLDEDRRAYHYACPREWLARTKEDIKVVALVDWAKSDLIGQYSNAGGPAYTDTWNVVFVDVSENHVVATAHIKETDPTTRDNLFGRDHNSRPTESEVVSAIRHTISFAQTVHKD